MSVDDWSNVAEAEGAPLARAPEAPQDADALLSGRLASSPELVIALVTGIGTDVSSVVEDFRAALQAVSYQMEYVRVSQLIHDLSAGRSATRVSETKAETLMDEGDALRDAVKHGGAACAL